MNDSLITTLIYLVAILHCWFFILESFLWTRPIGMKLMRIRKAEAESTQVLALNQGVYNLVLALGLLRCLYFGDIDWAICILLAITLLGFIGAISTKKIIIFIIQSVPAMAALAALILGST